VTRTQLGILWGLGVLIVAILAGLGWVLSQSRQPEVLPAATLPAERPPPAGTPAQAAYRLPETPHSARNQYARAQDAARAWQPDAALVSAAASWPFAGLDDFSRPVDWTFQFYSPATGRAYTTNVDQTDVTPIRETLSPYALPVIDLEQWQIDSYQAVNEWLNQGGGTFLKKNPVVDVSIRLARQHGETPTWTVVGIDDSGEVVQTTRVDARASEVRGP
jgi:hypothetical protein